MSDLISQVKDIVHEDVNLCYQCEKCTSGCPVSMEMELIALEKVWFSMKPERWWRK